MNLNYKLIIALSFILLVIYYNSLYIFNELLYSDINFKPNINCNDKIGIIGGGVTGLTIAYNLLNNKKTKNNQIELFESKDKLNGNIQNYEPNCPAMMSCFDYNRCKHIKILMKELGIKPTKVYTWKKCTLYDNGERFIVNNSPLGNSITFSEYMEIIKNYKKFYELLRAIASINYFTSNDKFNFSEFFHYARKHYKYYYYTIENGNVSKLVNKLHDKIKLQTSIYCNHHLKKIKIINNKVLCYFSNGFEYIFNKLVLTIPPHYIKNIIDPNTENIELQLLYKLSKCYYGQKSYSMLHIDEKVCLRDSSLTYEKKKYKNRYHYILHINPRLFYNVPTIPANRRVSIWYEYEDLNNINDEYIISKRYSEISIVIKGKESEFKNTLKKIQNNKHVYIASSYLSPSKWCNDAVRLASHFKNI